MVAKTGLVVSLRRGESKDRWKSDRPGTQILFIRGFTQTELVRFFFAFFELVSFTRNCYLAIYSTFYTGNHLS